VVTTLAFDAVGVGTSSLDFDFGTSNQVIGSNAQELTLDSETGSVTVGSLVPEPTGRFYSSLGFALTASGVRRRPDSISLYDSSAEGA
jgi:hypothetical protein